MKLAKDTGWGCVRVNDRLPQIAAAIQFTCLGFRANAVFARGAVEVWTKGGLTTFYLLFVMELKTRRVNFASCTTNSNEAWMKTIARELTNHEDGFLKDKKYLIMDGDATFSKLFRASLRRAKLFELSSRTITQNEITRAWATSSSCR